MKTESHSINDVLAKNVRFFLPQTVVDVTRNNFQFIPELGKYEGEYTDKMLMKRWGISDDEWNFIDSKIKNIGTNETAEVDE